MEGKRITKRAIDALSCPESKDRIFLWDKDLSGFGVAAFPSGKKVYVAQYRKDGRSHRLSIGEHGRLNPDEARSLAKIALGSVESGGDPIDDRRTARAAKTFEEVAEKYLAEHVAKKRSKRTKADYERLLNLHILPALGSRRLVTITSADVGRLHQAMSDRPGAANRALALISAVWNWAAKNPTYKAIKRDNNPASETKVEHFPGNPNERFLTDEEVSKLGGALRLAETGGIPWAENPKTARSKHQPKSGRETVIDPYAAAAIRLLLLTGARLREILHAKWADLDTQRAILFLPNSKNSRQAKKRDKSEKRKPIYLSEVALNLIKAIPRSGNDPYIIAGGKEHRNAKGERVFKPRADLKRPWNAIRRAAGLNGVRLHDLRHSFAAAGAGASLGLPMIGRLLGHVRPETTARYAHLAAGPMHRSANLIGNQLAAALAATEKPA